MGACDIASGPNATVTGAGTGASPWSIAQASGAWSTTLPNPVFSAGVTVGTSTIVGRWRTRRSASGELLMDYTGQLTLASGFSIIGAVSLAIPNSRVAADTQHQMQILYSDGGNPFIGWWVAGFGGTSISFRRVPSGTLSSTQPFTWAIGDQMRWNVRGLLVNG